VAEVGAVVVVVNGVVEVVSGWGLEGEEKKDEGGRGGREKESEREREKEEKRSNKKEEKR